MISMEEIEAYLQEHMRPGRLAHARRVAETAASLADRFGADAGMAELAGLLHDICRDDGDALLLKKAQKFGIFVDEIEVAWPVLLHGPVAAKEASERLHIVDEGILSAIQRHTTGGPRMSALDAVVFLADFIEPGRDFPEAEVVRRTAGEAGLWEAVSQTASLTMTHLMQKHQLVHPDMLMMYNQYLLKRKDDNGG